MFRIKGRKLPTPQEVVQKSKRTPATVTWYGGANRKIEFVSGTGHGYKTGQGLVPIRWVFVHDRQGTHRDEYFYTTDPTLTGPQIISRFTARWSIETTFQEMRTYLGFETTKQRTQKSVLRMAPVLLGLFTAICLIFARQTRSHRAPIRKTGWYLKAEPTFTDAIAAVRRLLWREILFKHPWFHDTVEKLQTKFKLFLLEHLSAVA